MEHNIKELLDVTISIIIKFLTKVKWGKRKNPGWKQSKPTWGNKREGHHAGTKQKPACYMFAFIITLMSVLSRGLII